MLVVSHKNVLNFKANPCGKVSCGLGLVVIGPDALWGLICLWIAFGRHRSRSSLGLICLHRGLENLGVFSRFAPFGVCLGGAPGIDSVY